MDDLLTFVEVLGGGEPPPPLIAPDPPRKKPKEPQTSAVAGADAAGAEAATNGGNPCHRVTLAAVVEVRDAVDRALEKARLDETLNGTDGGYPSATKYSVTFLALALERSDRLVNFLRSFESQFFDKDGFMINTSATYSVYGYMRDVVHQVHLGRHWSAVSCAYNSHLAKPPRNNEHAVACIEGATAALTLAEPLGADATRCYISGYS